MRSHTPGVLSFEPKVLFSLCSGLVGSQRTLLNRVTDRVNVQMIQSSWDHDSQFVGFEMLSSAENEASLRVRQDAETAAAT